jgi:regulator of replication initiation timing
VNTLSELIAKNNAPSLIQADSTRIKKTADMTYHEFLQKVLASRAPLDVTAKKQSYRLQEDLELLLELSSYSAISNKSFEEVVAKKRIHRTVDSLKSRYGEHLSKIGEAEMKKIVSWVEREGVDGYLYFEDKELRISLSDPREEKKEEKQEKKEDKKRARPASLDNSEKKFERKKEGAKKNIPTNCRELNDILKLYSKMVNVPIKTLLERLDQVSGDFLQLDNFIETKDSKILWSSEEDEILRKGGVEVDLLRKYRGAAVDARKKYLGIN